MTLTPTPEQSAIIEAAVGSDRSLLISALAGAAKTTTLELICKALPSSTPILSLAFNKRIAQEMERRLPGNVKCQTLNSLGHGVWSAACAKRLSVDAGKSRTILKGLIDALPARSKGEAYETYAETLGIIRAAKVQGYIPAGTFPNARRLINGEFFESLEEEPTPTQRRLVDETLVVSIREAYAGRIDFDDQIYLPALFGGQFPRFPLVMVDEAQDLSPLNHAILDKLVTRRIIAVGDAFQSIYAFRGADTSSMPRLRARFDMDELHLSVSFRCPRAVVALARSRAPTMQWPDWAAEGRVVTHDQWSAHDLPDGCTVLCRNNAPLFRLAMALLRAGRGVNLVGSDIGPSLVRSLRKLGDDGRGGTNDAMTQADLLSAIDRWEAERLAKSKSKASIADKADCLRVFAEWGPTLGVVLATVEKIFSAQGPINLMSGHKAKGLEWDLVFHLDPWRIPSKWATTPEELEQEDNLRYVITTRAKRELHFINLEDYAP